MDDQGIVIYATTMDLSPGAIDAAPVVRVLILPMAQL